MLKRVAMLALCAIAGMASAARPGWQFIDLGTLGGNNAVAMSINNAGEIAGTSGMQPGTRMDTDTGGIHAFLWSNGVMQDLGSAGQRNSEAKAINHHGVVVGALGENLNEGQATMWGRDGLPTPMGFRGVPFDINKHGVAVGYERMPDWSAVGIVWRDGAWSRLSDLGLGRATPIAINDHGVIAGFSDTPQGASRAVIWENGVIRNLGTLGGTYSSAADINNHGVVVGTSAVATGFLPQAFIWDGVMRPLLAQGPNDYSIAFSINNRGDVVGQMMPAGGRMASFLLSDGELTMLMDLVPAAERSRYVGITGMAINDRGWIVGHARRTDGALRAFLLKPR